MSSPARPDDVPEHVRSVWAVIHEELQRRLEVLYERRAAFKLWSEMSGEGGVPRLVDWAEDDRQQAPAAPRRKAG